MNLALRDIRHKPGRFALTCVGLSLLLGVVLSMIGIYRGLVADALTLARAPQADIWVVESGTRGPFAESSRDQQSIDARQQTLGTLAFHRFTVNPSDTDSRAMMHPRMIERFVNRFVSINVLGILAHHANCDFVFG